MRIVLDRTWVCRLIALILLLLPVVIFNPTPRIAASAPIIPIRVAILVNEENIYANSNSELFNSIKSILNLNKMPFDVVETNKINKDTFINENKEPRYSALLVLGSGWLINEENSNRIIEAVKQGTGVLGILSDSSNEYLNELFGIEQSGVNWGKDSGISFLQDMFTFSYKGETIQADVSYLDHKLVDGIDIVAYFTRSSAPAIWTYKYNEGKSVFHNSEIVASRQYRGLLLQSILYAMPVGVANPINVGVIEVDDSPRSFDTEDQLQKWHYNYTSNFMKWLKMYNFRASFFVAFSYSGNTDDFWRYPQNLKFVNELIKSGYELGLHCGSKHIPLDTAYWTDRTNIEIEVDKMKEAEQTLREKLLETHGTKLGKIVSYVAPANVIGKDGYETLAGKTDIRYVGVSHVLATRAEEGGNYIDSDIYPPVFRDFGWEDGLDIFNLPRIQASFDFFNQPQHELYNIGWENLRSFLESGDAYIAFTHPEELELFDNKLAPGFNMSELFEAYRIWGNYVSSRFPFYRWWTSSELGQYLEKRGGTLKAEWLPKDKTLILQLSQPDDAIHIKTDGYLDSITTSGEQGKSIIMTFSDLPPNVPPESDKYDIVKVGRDYFIYPAGSKNSLSVTPEKQFEYVELPIPESERLVALTQQPENMMPPVSSTEVNRPKSFLYILLSFGIATIFLSGAIIAIVKMGGRKDQVK